MTVARLAAASRTPSAWSRVSTTEPSSFGLPLPSPVTVAVQPEGAQRPVTIRLPPSPLHSARKVRRRPAARAS